MFSTIECSFLLQYDTSVFLGLRNTFLSPFLDGAEPEDYVIVTASVPVP